MPPSSISFGSSDTVHVEENTDGIIRDVNASLNGGNVDEGLTYSISGGDDQALFNIDSTTGALSFISSPDYENPLDAGADNIYNITVTASDGGSATNSQDLTITVTNDVVEATGTAVTQGTIPLTGLDAGQGFTIGGGPAGDHAGASVASAGDINGDGFADIVIGAPNGWSVFPYSWYYSFGSGMAYVVFGHAGDSGTSVDVTSLDGTNGFAISGLSGGDYAGGSVASAGDVNGDGYDDLLISASTASPNGFASGQTYLIFGTGSGFPASVDLSSLDGSNGVTFNGSGVFDMAGASVASAGDINGDGIDDILIGASGSIPAYGYGTGTGKTYVVFGTNSGFAASVDLASLDGSNGFVVNGVQQFDLAGAAISSAGDVNGDGYDDIVIGAPGVSSYTGAAYVLFGSGSGFSASIDLSSLDGTNGFVMTGLAAGDGTGWSVSSAGDINGDGYDDILIGARTADANGADSGTTYVVFGTGGAFAASIDLSSLDGSNGFVLYGGAGGDRAGQSVSAAGDLNGDGYDDILIGASGVSSSVGGTYVLLGHGGSFGASLDLSTVSGGDGSTGFMLAGVDANDQSGRAVSAAGDVNGDGFPDFIIGAPNGDLGGNNSGEAYVIYGEPVTPAVQFATSADQTLMENTTAVVCDINASLNGGNADEGLTYSITGGADQASFSIDSATGVLSFNTTPDYEARADVGNDNVYNVIVTATGGGALTNQQALTISITNDPSDDLPGVVQLFALDGTDGVTFNGVGYGDLSGQAVSSAGDINGDGYDDIIIGAPQADPNGANSGAAYVVFGSAGGFDTTVELSTLDGSNGFELTGVNASDKAGRSVSSAGDVNGDGYDDLLIGAPGANGAGATYVIFGSASGFGASFDLSSLNGTNGFVLNGTTSQELSGFSVASAGDINGDGYEDILVGAQGASFNGSYSGAAYVVFGAAGGFAASTDLSSLDGTNGFLLSGLAAGDRVGWSVSSAGDINGDGYDDIIIGEPQNDPSGATHGAAYVVFGSAGGFAASFDLSSLDGSNGFVLNGLAAGDGAGFSVSSAGDVNGDGYDDFLIGAPAADPNGSQSGVTYVVFGSGSGFSASFDLSSLDGSNGFVINGVNAGDFAGHTVSSAGDINGDGFDDILVGANGSSPYGFAQAGKTYVIYGAASGFGASIELSTLAAGDRSVGFVLDGGLAGDNSGFSVSSAGDVNGDGADDILVGAYGAEPHSTDNGQTYLVYGTPPATPAVIGGDTSASVGENETGTITGHLTISDVNGAAEESFNSDTLDGTYGSLTIDANGDWSYDLSEGNSDVQALLSGDTLGDTITVHSVDGTAQDISITINGVNDAATFGGSLSASLSEDTDSVGGTATVSDVDGADSFTPETLASTYGTVSMAANGDWIYDLDTSNSDIQALGAGDTLGDTIAVHAADGTTQDISITINGVNDAATFGGSLSASLSEDTDSVGGTATATDIDGANSFAAETLDGTYGTLTMAANGDWIYDLDQSNSDVQALLSGDTLGDSATVHAADGTAQDIVITINGANDDATFGGTLSASISEDTESVGGTATATDVDGADSFTPETLAGTYGTLTMPANGDWIYDLDTSNGDIQALGDGDTLGDTFAVHAADGTAQDIVLTIDGVNDAPTTADGSVSATEHAATSFTVADFSFSDVDTGDSLVSVRIDSLPVSGTLALGGSAVAAGDVVALADIGSLTYTPTNNDSAARSFSFSVSDGSAWSASATMSIDVQGVNDAPSGPALTSSGVVENEAGVFVGTLSAHDPEGDAVTFSTADDRFDIKGDELWLKAGVSLDYEATPTVSLQVYATDPQGLNGGSTVRFSVIDVAEGTHTTGTSGNDTLDGGDGNDRIASGGGNDFVVGDGVYGSSNQPGYDGSDTLMGGAGNDTLLGGGWEDNGNGHYDAGEEVSGGTSQNFIWGGAGNDVAVGSGGGDRIGGGADDDYLQGLGGDDTLFGGSGDDTLQGGVGDDLIYNGRGNDSVEGGAGDDTLWASAGDDTLTGGDGADMFVFGAVSGNDTISDFNMSDDSLDLAACGFADMTAVTTASSEVTVDGQSGLLIDLGDGDSVFLVGLQVHDLGGMDITL